MTAIRRTALMVALTLIAFLGSAGSTAPAQASFGDTVTGVVTLATNVVAAPTNFTGAVACAPGSGTMSATWTASTTPRVTGYTLNVYFSDGYTQTVELPATATSWSASIDPYYITAFTVQYRITTHTDYGWFKNSARTAQLRC